MTGAASGDDVAAVAAVVLAAGGSARMGRPKLALPWGDTTILGHVLATYRAAGVERIVVAVRAGDADAVAAAEAAGAQWTAVEAARSGGGPTASLQAALAVLGGGPVDGASAGTGAARGPQAAAGLLVQPADMPLITAASVATVVGAYRALPVADRRRAIVAPSFTGRRGHPVLFGPGHVAALIALDPDRPPRAVIASHVPCLRLVAVPDIGVTLDIDDDAAYRRHHPRPTA